MRFSKTFVVRIILSLLLIYGVYLETGVFTALFAFLTCVAIEANNLLIKVR